MDGEGHSKELARAFCFLHTQRNKLGCAEGCAGTDERKPAGLTGEREGKGGLLKRGEASRGDRDGCPRGDLGRRSLLCACFESTGSPPSLRGDSTDCSSDDEPDDLLEEDNHHYLL